MSTMPSVGSGTYSPGPNMVCSPEQEKVGTGSIEAIIYPVYSDLRIRATVSSNPEEFSQAELVLLAEKTYDISDKGEAEERPYLGQIGKNLKFAFRCFAKAFD